MVFCTSESYYNVLIDLKKILLKSKALRENLSQSVVSTDVTVLIRFILWT